MEESGFGSLGATSRNQVRFQSVSKPIRIPRRGRPQLVYSTLAQSSAAIVGLAGGFMVSRILAQRNDLARDRAITREQMLILQGRANIGIEGAERVSSRIREVLPTAENTHELAVERIETFTHPGRHGQKRTNALDTQHLELLRSVESDATEYKKTLTELAKDPKTLADNLRKGCRRPRARLAERVPRPVR
jgi:hypothetical protein